jgi:hypothetical protein
MVRAWLYRLLRPLFVRALDYVPLKDSWEQWSQRIPPWAYSRGGSLHEFSWYFQAESAVRVTSIEDICAWLLACEFVSDQELFGQKDFWQHPCEFEKLRKGDCDDHALWAWRKLSELGYITELVVGRRLEASGEWDGHAWVQCSPTGEQMVLEAAEKDPARMLRPLTEVKRVLRPHFAVRSDLHQTAFEGYMHSVREDARRARGRRKGVAQVALPAHAADRPEGRGAPHGRRPPRARCGAKVGAGAGLRACS